jgi:F0F1-type ATP synthase delta subunit
VCDITKKQFKNSYGFSEEEMKELLSKVFEGEDDGEVSDVLSSMSNWYNGYIVDGMRIYNPFEVMRHLG